MSDLISRQDAIDAIGDEPEVWMDDDEYAKGMKAQWKYDRKAIEDLPSAERKGKWIEDGYQDYPCVCSYCGTRQDIKAKFLFSYCPNCGSDNRGEEDD